MSNYSQKTNKFVRFLRNNVALLLIIFCALAIATVVLVVTLTETPAIDTPVDNDPDPTTPTDQDPDPDPEPVYETVKVYYVPATNYSGIGMGYTDETEVLFVYNATVKLWTKHYGVNLLAEAGTDVVAMQDGTVISVGSTFGDGNFVVIDHGEGVVITYASLEDISVVEGQVVELGERIGATSTSASYYYKDGAHVQIKVEVNGQRTDPMPYVNGEMFIEVQRLVEE